MRAVRAPSVTYQRPRGVTAWADDGPPSVEGGPVLRQRAANWTNGERVALLFFGVRADSTHGRPSFRWMTRYVVLSDVNFTCSDESTVIIWRSPMRYMPRSTNDRSPTAPNAPGAFSVMMTGRPRRVRVGAPVRSEEHTSELQSLMRL